VEAVVIAGECLGTSAVIDTYIPITMLDIRVKAGGSHTQHIPVCMGLPCYRLSQGCCFVCACLCMLCMPGGIGMRLFGTT
jgi:hypothetical protein